VCYTLQKAENSGRGIWYKGKQVKTGPRLLTVVRDHLPDALKMEGIGYISDKTLGGNIQLVLR
jgi:hypothetical protein